MVQSKRARRALCVLLLCVSLHHAGATESSHAMDETLNSIADPIMAGISSTQPGPSTSILDRLGRFLSRLFPEDTDVQGDGGLLGDGTSLAWGGSTIEVVKTQASYLTRAAAFGPHITSDEGLKGGLLPISDFYHPQDANAASISIENHGCPFKGGPGWRDEDFDDSNEDIYREVQAPFRPVGKAGRKPPNDWIALVERGGECSFVSKIRVAQALGAKAVVVGDAPSEDYDDGNGSPGEHSDPGKSGKLVTMFAPGDTSDVHIPSTFITRPSYVDLIRLIDEMEREGVDKCVLRKKEGKECDYRADGLEVILGRDDIMWEWPLIDLAFILLLLPSFMTMATIIVHRIRLTRQRRRERAPEIVVLGLPCLIWRPDGQPWEKVEGSEAGVTTSEEQQRILKKEDASAKQHRQESQDMELGNTQSDDGQTDQAGPSSAPLKTIPVAPPAPVRQHSYLPPGRTYYSCDECAICLSEFVDGEKVRVLPCGHVFHLPEIDSWLLRVKKLCPICKRDITVPIPPTPPAPSLHAAHSPQAGVDAAAFDTPAAASADEADNADEADSETSPLLARPPE